MYTHFTSLLCKSVATTLVCTSLLCGGETFAQEHQRAHFGLVYPISTNGIHAAQVSNTISLHALAGLSGGEDGVAVSGLATIVKGSQRGVAVSGLCTLVSDQASGVQISGLLNTTEAQDGVQVAGLVNVSATKAGVQIAGLSNISASATVQVAGLTNSAAKSSRLQIAGLVNTSGESHTQLAGLVNIARKAKGLQVAGLINIAAESNYPIGLLNIIGNGTRQLGATIDEAGNAVVAFRSGGRYTYGILGAGMNVRMPDAPYAIEAGLGWHIPMSKALRLNLELSNTANTDFWDAAYYKSSCRVLLGVQLGRIELVAGPSFNYVNYLSGLDAYNEGRSIWDFYGDQSVNSLFLGGMAGIHFKL